MAVQNGDSVKHLISGFAGIVVGRSEWLNGCIHVAVQSFDLKDGKPVNVSFDEPELEVVEAGAFWKKSGRAAPEKGDASPGGPVPSCRE